jgi:hypothetical protein
VCGQNDRNYLRAAHRIIGEILSETFELDSRLLVTLRGLLFHPGYLSREFSAGRRARYVSPVRLYLIASVVFFFCVSVFGRGGVVIDDDVTIVVGDTEQAEQVAGNLKGQVPEEDLSKLRAAPDQAPTGQPRTDFEKTLQERIDAFRANPDAAFDVFFDNLPFMMFLLLPLAAGLLKLFYRQRFYSEHLVFALHVHAFLFLLFTLELFIPDAAPAEPAEARNVWWDHLETALNLVGGVYVLTALKYFYGQPLVRTLLKAAAIFALYSLLLSVGIVSVLFAAIWLA